MRYYIDTEFDGFRGPLISMALVREDGRSLYFIIQGMDRSVAIGGLVNDPWVIENVLPILRDCPESPQVLDLEWAAVAVAQFLGDAINPVIIADWPDDIRHLCDVLHYSPGHMPHTAPVVRFEIHRVDAYPTALPAAVQHNAWWDAVALREKLESDTVTP